MPLTPAPEEVFTIAPPPCSSIRGTSYFMHKNTPRRLMATIRSHSSSVTSAIALTSFSTPALLKAASSRPKVSMVSSRAAFTSSVHVTSHATASARPPSSSIRRAVSRTFCSKMSETTPAAPSRANASAVARPMPLAAPVTNATFPAWLPWSFVAISRSFSRRRRHSGLTSSGLPQPSGPHHYLDRLAIVHRPVAVGHPVEAHDTVEDAAGLDPALQHVRQELLYVGAHRRGPAAHGDVAEERRQRGGDRLVLGHADAADRAARARDAYGRSHRLTVADALQHRVGAEATCEPTHALDGLLAPLAHHVRRAELPRQRDAVFV